MFKARALVGVLASWALLVGVAFAQATADSVSASGSDQAVTVTVVSDGAPDTGFGVAYGSVVIGEYWVGLQCYPATPPLRAQLNLPEKQGLVVATVVPESPAAKAGIAKHDILMKAGEKALASPRDLVEAVDAAKGKALKIEVIHSGARKTVEATPTKRPERLHAMPQQRGERPDIEVMQKWVEGMQSGELGEARTPFRFRIFHPGAIVPKDVLVKRPFPANLNVVISKEGDQPAKITVKRGDQKWEVTEKELDKLPADVRPHVDQLLGRGIFGIVSAGKAFDVLPDIAPLPPMAAEGQLPPPMRIPLDPRMEKRFDELNQRIDKLFQAMEEMREGKSEKKK